MESLGINWFLLFSQIAFCGAVPLGVALAVVLAQVKQPSRVFVSVLGFLTAWVTIFAVIAVAFFISSRFNPSAGFTSVLNLPPPATVLATITVLVTVMMMAYYISHAARSSLISNEDRIYYQIALVLLPVISMPLYYLKFVKNEFLASQTS